MFPDTNEQIQPTVAAVLFFLEAKSRFGDLSLGDGFIYFELLFETTDVLFVSFFGELGSLKTHDAIAKVTDNFLS